MTEQGPPPGYPESLDEWTEEQKNTYFAYQGDRGAIVDSALAYNTDVPEVQDGQDQNGGTATA